MMSLSRLYTGMQAIGVSQEDARPLIYKVAMDCIPALRRDVFDRLAENDDKWKTSELATTLGYPYQTTKRTLEDLTAHGVVHRQPGRKNRPSGTYRMKLFRVISPGKTGILKVSQENTTDV